MHAVGIHSAMAIKRQRKRRDEQRRAKERRYSIQSSESGDTQHSPHGSTRRKYRHPAAHSAGNGMLDTKVVTSIGMLHIGVVFVVFGIFLLGAGILPDDISTWNLFGKNTWWNELVCTGLFAIGLGIFLIVLNCLISKREEDDLEEYVQRQLTRSRSGHRLERDLETGGLTTRHNRRIKSHQVMEEDNLSQSNVTPITSEMITPTTPQDIGISGDMLLEKILEEDSIYGDDRTRDNLSPIGGNDTKYLLGNGHTVNITRI
ncbi:uncharacterized protein LOC119071292 isoform X2 [Bradysia coprophila]|nr:uncharacterized protein LOC119071292 isoform X2 [Bradysia coprophila]